MTTRLMATAALLWLSACAPDNTAPLVATDVEVTPPRAGVSMRAAYLRIRNNTDTPVRITSAASPHFERVEMHETVVEDDIARMRPVAEVTIDAQGEVVFERGGLHLMLMRPRDTSHDESDIRLDFFDGDGLLFSVTARQAEL